MPKTKEELREYQKQWLANHPGYQSKATKKWRAKHPGYSTLSCRRWRAKYPEKYEAIYNKYNHAITGKKILERRKNIATKASQTSLSYNKEAVRLLTKGKDPIDVAMWLRLPVSIVMQIKQSLQPSI